MTIWHFLAIDPDSVDLTLAQKRQLRMFVISTLAAFWPLLIFGFIHSFVLGNSILGAIELVVGLILAVNFLSFKANKHIDFAANILLGSLFVIIIALLVTGGVANTGYFWVFGYIAGIYYLMGPDNGRHWAAILFLSIILLLVLDGLKFIDSPYTIVQFIQLIVSALVLTVIVDASEVNRLQNEQANQKNTQALLEAKASIEEEVTQRTKEIQEAKARMLAAIGNLNIGFIITNNNLGINMINAAAIKLLCASDSRLASRVLKGDNYSITCTMNDIAREIGKNFDIKTEAKKCLESLKPVKHENVPMFDRFINIFISPVVLENKAIGSVILLDDATEHHKWEKVKDDFFSIAAHELRTPLTVIRGNTSIMKDLFAQKIKDNEAAELIGDIHDASIRLIDIVNDFLDVSRLEQKRLVFHLTKFDLFGLIQDTLTELQPLIARKKLGVEIEKPKEPLPPVYSDPERVKQVVLNLVGNAIKFTQEGKIIVKVEPFGSFIKIYISDTGGGIAPENQDSLFRKFQQTESNVLTHDRTKGTGLGLYISRLLIESLGGTINLEHSQVGKGSTFGFTVPLTLTKVKILDKKKNKG